MAKSMTEIYLDALKIINGWATVSEWAEKVGEVYPEVLEKAEKEAMAHANPSTGLREIAARISSAISRSAYQGLIELDESERPRKVRSISEAEAKNHEEKELEEDLAPITRNQKIKTAIDNENKQRFVDGLGPSGVEIKIEDYTQKISTLLSDISSKLNNWEIMFNFLVEFKKEFGHCNVPRGYNPKLASWIITQRSKKNKLSKEKVTRLEKIGFEWDPIEAKWEANFTELLKYKKEFGHCSVPSVYKPNTQLGIWVTTQRSRKDRISKENIARLEKIGFEWDPIESQWEASFSELLKFKKEFGHSNVPREYKTNPKLGNWVTNQRRIIDKLSKENIARLEEIGFDWDPIESMWEANFTELLKFKKEFGHCRVPSVYKPNHQLGTWFRTQINKKDKLSKDRFAKLKKIGFEWKKR